VSGSYSSLEDSSSVVLSLLPKRDRTELPTRFKKLAFPDDFGSARPSGPCTGTKLFLVLMDSGTIRTLGRCDVLRTDFTLRPTAAIGFSVVEDGGGPCDEDGGRPCDEAIGSI